MKTTGWIRFQPLAQSFATLKAKLFKASDSVLTCRKGRWNKNNTIRVLPCCREYVRLSAPHAQHRRRRLIVWHDRHGQHMTPLRHEVIVAASLHNVGGPLCSCVSIMLPASS